MLSKRRSLTRRVRVALALVGCLIGVSPAFAQATDDFNRADGGLGANWTDLHGGFSITSNEAVSTGGSSQSVMYTASTPGNDQYAQVVLVVYGTGGPRGGPAVRMSAGTNFYAAWLGEFATAIDKVVGGTYTQLATAAGIQDFGGPGFVGRLEVQGTTLRLIYNGTTIITTTDSALSSGVGGMHDFGGGARFDSFEVGTLPGGAGARALTGVGR